MNKTNKTKFKSDLRNKKSAAIMLRVSEQDRELFEKLALAKGESLSQVIREATIQAASDAGLKMEFKNE